MDAPLTPLLLDAKTEYVGQLTDVIAPFVLGRLRQMWDATRALAGVRRVREFQRLLREIPTWNANTIASHAAEIVNRTPYLPDLIAAVFVSYTKILSSIKLSATGAPSVRLRLPDSDALLHQVYVHTARDLYDNPAVIASPAAAPKVAVVRAAIETAVRQMLPIGDILRAYLGNAVDGEGTMNAVPDEVADDGLGLFGGQPQFGGQQQFGGQFGGQPQFGGQFGGQPQFGQQFGGQQQQFGGDAFGGEPQQQFGMVPVNSGFVQQPAFGQQFGQQPAFGQPAFGQPGFGGQQLQDFAQPQPQDFPQPQAQDFAQPQVQQQPEFRQINVGGPQQPMQPQFGGGEATGNLFSDAEDEF